MKFYISKLQPHRCLSLKCLIVQTAALAFCLRYILSDSSCPLSSTNAFVLWVFILELDILLDSPCVQRWHWASVWVWPWLWSGWWGSCWPGRCCNMCGRPVGQCLRGFLCAARSPLLTKPGWKRTYSNYSNHQCDKCFQQKCVYECRDFDYDTVIVM